MSKYPKKIEKTGKSIDEAVEAALEELKVTRDAVEIEVIDEGNKGFLGIGAKDAVVSVSVKEDADGDGKKFLEDIFKAMKLDVSIDIESTDDAVNIELSGDQMGIIIGKRGDTLDSLQYLTSLVINSKSEKYKKVTIDTENYREKRYEALVALAGRLARKVEKSGKKYTLEPMNPYERRIIHASLQDNDAVTTFSIGEDPYRKVVISPKDGVKPARPTGRGRRRPEKREDSKYSRDNAKYSSEKKSAPSVSNEAVFIDYANYAKERAMRPKVTPAKAGSFDEYLASQEKEKETSEE